MLHLTFVEVDGENYILSVNTQLDSLVPTAFQRAGGSVAAANRGEKVEEVALERYKKCADRGGGASTKSLLFGFACMALQ